jgi:S1-C subfamily serine protease
MKYILIGLLSIVLSVSAFADRFLTDNIVQIIREDMGRGTGFMIDDGKILTARHVIADCNAVVVIYTDKKEEYSTKMVLDSKADVGLIRVRRKCEQKPTISYETPDIGTTIYVHGYPYAFEILRLTKGIVASDVIRRSDDVHKDRGWEYFFLTDAVFAAGNSGSPVFNDEQIIVGIAVGRYDNVFLCVPAERVADFVRNVK